MAEPGDFQVQLQRRGGDALCFRRPFLDVQTDIELQIARTPAADPEAIVAAEPIGLIAVIGERLGAIADRPPAGPNVQSQQSNTKAPGITRALPSVAQCEADMSRSGVIAPGPENEPCGLAAWRQPSDADFSCVDKKSQRRFQRRIEDQGYFPNPFQIEIE